MTHSGMAVHRKLGAFFLDTLEPSQGVAQLRWHRLRQPRRRLSLHHDRPACARRAPGGELDGGESKEARGSRRSPGLLHHFCSECLVGRDVRLRAGFTRIAAEPHLDSTSSPTQAAPRAKGVRTLFRFERSKRVLTPCALDVDERQILCEPPKAKGIRLRWLALQVFLDVVSAAIVNETQSLLKDFWPMKLLAFYFSVLMLLATACTTGEKISDIHEGMSRAEVDELLGKPDGFRRDGNFVGYTYSNRLISGWSYDRADYHVIFENDRAVQWGAGEVRQGTGPNVGTLLLVPF